MSIETTIRIVGYLFNWAVAENMGDVSEMGYQDAMGFMQWNAKRGVSQKTMSSYLIHIRHYYDFLKAEGEVRENPVAHIKVQGIKRKIYHDILTGDELEKLYRQYVVFVNSPVGQVGKGVPPQLHNQLSRKRNQVMLGLLVYQGLRVEELAALRLEDVLLREGKISIPARRRTAGRVMGLESHQVYELMDYVHGPRKELLATRADTGQLFLQRSKSANFYGITAMLLKTLRKLNPRIRNLDQLRASVITGWLKQYDLRKVQYLSGHKYVSSTEAYRVNVIDELQDDITKFHPL